jgi:hypothetical protein
VIDVTTPVTNGGKHPEDYSPEDKPRSDVGAALAHVNRDAQLSRLLDHFAFSTAHAAEVLGCTPNAIAYRRGRTAPARHTALDDRIDAVHYLATTLDAEDFPTAAIRDWLFSRSPYFAGQTPAARLARGDEEVVLEAGRCYLAGYSADDFVEHLQQLGLVPTGTEAGERRVLYFPAHRAR